MVIKNLYPDPDWYGIQLKMLDPVRSGSGFIEFGYETLVYFYFSPPADCFFQYSYVSRRAGSGIQEGGGGGGGGGRGSGDGDPVHGRGPHRAGVGRV